MPFRSVSSLFAPASVAVVGVTNSAANWGHRIVMGLREYGYPGAIHLVSPTPVTISDLPWHPDMTALPAGIEHVVALVRADATVAAIATAAERGAKSATVLAAGFEDAGTDKGRELAEDLGRIASAHGVALCGPNGMGLVSVAASFATFAERFPTRYEPGGFALVSQSGGLLGGVLRNAHERGLGISHAVSTGNETNRDVADYISHFAQDELTDVIGVVLEGVRRPAEFTAACEAAKDAGKPVIVLRSGRTEQGRAAALSHTGVLAASGATMDAVSAALGLLEVDSPREMIELAELAHHSGPPRSGLGVIAYSGGIKNLVTDQTSEFDLRLAELSDETSARISHALSLEGRPGNPVDVGIVGIAASMRDKYLHVVEALASDPGVGVIAVQEELPHLEAAVDEHVASLNGLAEIAAAHDTEMVFFSRADYDLGSVEGAARSRVARPFLQDVRASMMALSRYQAFAESALPTPPLSSRVCPADTESDAPQSAAGTYVLDDATAFRALAERGVDVASFTVLEATGTARELIDVVTFPLAVKALVGDTEHKTDRGAVRLGIRTVEELETVVALMRSRFGADSRLLVQHMVEGPRLEVFISCYRDPLFGWISILGAGGLWAESHQVRQSSIMPRSVSEAHDMVKRGPLTRYLSSARGKRLLDANALADAVWTICRAAGDQALGLTRLEINPLMLGRDAVAVDVVMEIAQSPTEVN